MATATQMAGLAALVSKFSQIDRQKLLRPSLGEEALEKPFAEVLERIEKGLAFAVAYSDQVDDSSISNVQRIYNDIFNQLHNQANYTNAQYVNQKSNFLTSVSQLEEQLRQFMPPFVAGAVMKRGFLEDEGIRKEYQRTIDSLREEAQSTLAAVREETTKTINEAKELAKQIEERARKTAAHISVDEAQKQFASAQASLDWKVKLWAAISVGVAFSFLGYAYYISTAALPKEWTWQILYYTAIRIALLTALGSAASFCLAILRAHMHMAEQNLHRQRVANSIAAFVESAITPEQRDAILSQLVDSVASFGNSGLLQGEDSGKGKMSVDTVVKSFTAAAGKTS